MFIVQTCIAYGTFETRHWDKDYSHITLPLILFTKADTYQQALPINVAKGLVFAKRHIFVIILSVLTNPNRFKKANNLSYIYTYKSILKPLKYYCYQKSNFSDIMQFQFGTILFVNQLIVVQQPLSSLSASFFFLAAQ